MSLDYVVFCRERPRFAAGAYDIGPIAVNGPTDSLDRDPVEEPTEDTVEDDLDPWAMKRIPAEARAGAGRWRVYLNCGGRGAEHADDLGELIAAHSGGGWVVCDHGDEGTPVEPAAEPWTDDDILPRLIAAVERGASRVASYEASRRAAEQARWEADRAKDPAAAKDADDWSDV